MKHLRIKTEYSFKQTFAPISRCVDRLKKVGATHAAIVDRDGTWGHVWWHEACRKAGIVPIMGVELIVSEEDDVVTGMWFLAKNAAGLREMYHFTSKAFKQRIKTKFGSKPRLFKADVLNMSDNVYKFAGEILDGPFLKACDAILDLSPASRVLNMSKKRLAEELGLRLVSTCDNVFAFPEDKETFELMDGRNKPSKQYILEESEMPECPPWDLEFEPYDLPKAPNLHKEGNLEVQCRVGIQHRTENQGLRWSDKYEKRLRREIDLIKEKGFDSYFLIVSDIVRYAKTKMLVGPSRGSCGGSLVCYLMLITEIDPVPAGLYFERFIDESRKDLPDIDIDFPSDKRHIVGEYMALKYTHTASIGTVSRFKSKSALIQVCKKLSIPPIATYATKAAIITRTSGDARGSDSLVETLETTKAGQDLVKLYPDIRRACDLENHASHTGVHAAGILVCDEPLENYCTVTDDGTAMVEKKTCEALNLLKVDVLGLRTLDILEDCRVKIDWYRMKLDDPETYKIFNEQKLSGIFQFEGQSMRNLSKQVAFKSIHDIDNVTALARPGPFGGGVTAEWLERRKGKKFEPFHPLVEAHMKETFGLPVYQEQTMAIVREIGQFDWTKVSSIRKAVSLKKGKEFFDQYYEYFEKGAVAQGMPKEDARKTWDYINSMGAYQMNKAHTYSYAVIGYWCAYLKAHHPVEFAAANLRHAKDEASSLTMLQEMVREGMKYEPFNVEKSQETWSVKDGVLIAGFDSLKGFGPVKAKKFAEERDAGRLTDAQYDQLEKARSVFSDLFPIRRQYRQWFEEWEAMGLSDPPTQLIEINGTKQESFVFIGKILSKNLRDDNEAVNLKKRNGKRVLGNPIFLDFRVVDDTAQVQVRIKRQDYLAMGKPIFEAPIGTVVLVRANFPIRGATFGFVQKVKILEVPETQEAVCMPERAQTSFKFQEDEIEDSDS